MQAGKQTDPGIWDAIVVGAGPAGCAAAYDLAAAGKSVLLVDKAEFPRAKACAGGLTMRAFTALRYPVTPVVRHVVNTIVLEGGRAARSDGALDIPRSSPLCLMTVRTALDDFCLRQTIGAGARHRQIPPIRAIDCGSSAVTLELEDGEQLSGRFLIGADGVHSTVRALTSPQAAPPGAAALASWMRNGFAIEANVWMGRATPRALTFDFGAVAGGYGWIFPRQDHVNIGLYVYDAKKFNTPNRARLAAYIQERCGTDSFYGVTGQFLGIGADAHQPEHSRVLLAGDAGGFADPLTGEGIYGAVTSGQAAAAAVLQALKSARSAGDNYRQRTAQQRADLAIAARAAAYFYTAPEKAFRLLRYAPVRQGAIQTFSHGSSIRALSLGVRALSLLIPERTSQRSPECA